LAAIIGAAATSALSLEARQTNAESSRDLVFRDVDVLTMESPAVLRRQTVVVRGQQILTLAPSSSAVVPSDAPIVDGRGKVLMPGLIDMHVHLRATSELASYLRWGVTTIVHMSGETGRARDLLRRRHDLDTGADVGPRLFLAGPALDGSSPSYPDVSVALDSAEEARAEVRRQVDAGYDFIKIYNGLKPEILEAIAAETARSHVSFVGHVPRDVGLERSLALGQKLIAHSEEYFFTFFRAPRRTDISVEDMRRYRPDYTRMPDAVRLTEGAGAAVTPNLSFIEATRRMVEERQQVTADPEYAYLEPAVREMWTRQGPQNRRDLPQFMVRERTRGEFARNLVKALSGRVRILTGTDASAPGLFPGRSLHLEMQLLADAGLTRFGALEAATVSPGRFLERYTRARTPAGIVKPGYRADLLLLNGDPTRDLGHALSIAGVCIGGRYMTRATLDAARTASVRR
jgi:hypothetical protein